MVKINDQTESYMQSSLNLETQRVYPLLDCKLLDLYILKAIPDEILHVAEGMVIVHERIENLVEKGENAGYQHFLLFLQGFQKAILSRP